MLLGVEGAADGLRVASTSLFPYLVEPRSPYDRAAADAAKSRGSSCAGGYSFRYDGNAGNGGRAVLACDDWFLTNSTGFEGTGGGGGAALRGIGGGFGFSVSLLFLGAGTA